MAETQTSIYREAPEIEAARLALMNRARELSLREALPPGYEVAGLSNLQQAALEQAAGGIGAYQPFLTSAGETLGGAAEQLGGVMAGEMGTASRMADAEAQLQISQGAA